MKIHFPVLTNSAPGCGLWKAVERELNLSLVLHLRRGANIVESVCIPWKKGGSASTEFPILIRANQSIDLSECESKTFKKPQRHYARRYDKYA